MKKKVLLIISVLGVLGIFWAIIIGIGEKNDKKSSGEIATKDSAVKQQELTTGYTYHEVEQWVLRLADNDEEKKALGRLIDPLTKSNYITVSYIVNVAATIGAPDETYKKEILLMDEEECLTREQFDRIYDNMVNSGLSEGLRRTDILVYDLISYISDDGTSHNELYDGDNYYNLTESISEDYMNSIIDVYIKDDDIFRVNGMGSETVVFPNAWLISIRENQCTFLYNGMIKTYPVSAESFDVEECSIVSLSFDNTGIISAKGYDDTVRCRIFDVGDDVLEIENIGSIPLADNFKIYDISDTDNPFCEESLAMLKGHSEVLIVRNGAEVIGAVIEDEAVSKNIRVILSNDNYSSYKMPDITFSCSCSYEVQYSDGSSSVRTSDKITTIKYNEHDEGDVIRITPNEKNGSIRVLSLNRACGNPTYEGVIELRILEDGLHIINEVSLETYLYSVVSSEMPSGGHEEALKAMAICARGYAFTKMKDGSFDDYNADLDDSTLCQVYNNAAATEASKKAVKDTYGIVPVYNDVLIVPLYFSTSCGTTCTNVEVWGGTAYPYFQANLETHEKQSIDLSDEESFKQFMTDSMGYDIIDDDMPYYRWSISFTRDDMTNAINSMLKERMSVSPELIKEVDEEGEIHSTDVTDIGMVKSVKVLERSKSGVVNVLQIEGSLATIQISGQTNIRNIITPVNQQIVRHDNSVVTGWTSLPSPYYYVEETEDGFMIYGGGFGHGVGMSQSGAGILAEEGYNYKYILRHYYSYIDFSSIYIIENKKDE